MRRAAAEALAELGYAVGGAESFVERLVSRLEGNMQERKDNVASNMACGSIFALACLRRRLGTHKRGKFL